MRRIAAVLLLAASPASAQEKPPTVPTRDVAVTYQVKTAPEPIVEQWRFDAADQLARIDIGGVYMVSDLRAHTATMVSDAQRQAIQVPMPALDLTSLGSRSFTRIGAATVAGAPCTEWQTTDTRGQAVIACITPEGVMLRARRGDQVLVEASAVSFAKQDPSVFVVPSSYQRATQTPSR